ncbi:MAG: ABC transporter ATP-binding protein [Phycisphaerales bacterium]
MADAADVADAADAADAADVRNTIDAAGVAGADGAAEEADPAGAADPGVPRLAVTGLTVRLGPGRGHTIVHGVGFSIAPGQTLSLVGASGSGKTTIGRAVLQLVPIAGGRVKLDGVDLADRRGKALRDVRRGMQMVWQDPAGSLDPRMRIGDQVAEPLRVHGIAGRVEARRRAASLLDRCGLPTDCVDRYPAAFSGGQRQRIAIARALILEPGLLVCDEPTSALDVHVRQGIMDLLAEVQAERGLSMLFITHDLPLAAGLGGSVAVLDRGQIVEMGGSAVLRSPKHPVTRALIDAVPADHPSRSRIRGATCDESPAMAPGHAGAVSSAP